MFVDITRGERFDGITHDIYAEISPRFSIADNVYVATQLNAGNDYQAYLGGLGTDLHLPLFAFVSVNLYYKSDNIFDNTYQLSTAYKSLDFHGFHIEAHFPHPIFAF
jgi:nucleoside-specific outer membrane channel protein Tsx